MLKKILAAISIAIAPAALPLSVVAQPVTPAPPAPVDAQARQSVVTSLAAALRERYVFPDVGERAAARIGAALAAGEYDALADGADFAARLQADVEAIAHDKHLRIFSMSAPPPPPARAGPHPPRAEAGVVRADRLAGDIGYIEVVGFPPPEMFGPVIDRAMTSLAGSKALIIDARRNGGGAPPSVALLVSYLIAPDQPINDIVRRVPGTETFERESFRSTPTGVSFADVPVYVLVSDRTFSGGEEFAYDIQALERGVLIGEVTGGGANPTGPADLGAGFRASIPWGRAENPHTKANWEGVGVKPDVSVPDEEALQAALVMLGQEPALDVAAASLEQLFAPRSTPLAGTEAALRRLIEGVTSGTPDYGSMSPQFANLTRQQLAGIQGLFAPLGELQSVVFREVDPAGGDEYDVVFANGALRMAVILGADGKVIGGNIRPAPPPAS